MTNHSNRTEFIAIPIVAVVLGILFALVTWLVHRAHG